MQLERLLLPREHPPVPLYLRQKTSSTCLAFLPKVGRVVLVARKNDEARLLFGRISARTTALFRLYGVRML